MPKGGVANETSSTPCFRVIDSVLSRAQWPIRYLSRSIFQSAMPNATNQPRTVQPANMFMKNIIPTSGFRRIAAIIVGSKYAAVMNDKANNVDNVQLLRNVRSII